jgi:nucleoside-diphosphate-sugar epimerase
MDNKKVIAITGAAGHIGKMVAEEFNGKYILKLFNRRGNRESNESIPYNYIEISNPEELDGLLDGVDVLIHLAADRRAEAAWSSVYYNNILATYNIFEACRKSGVKRVIFASTNHVQHGYTAKTTPETFNLDFYEKNKLLSINDPTLADSLYGVSKIFGEELGKFYANKYNIEFIALRIGWTIPGDDPTIMNGTTAEDYMRAMYLSKKDCIQAFNKSIEVKMHPGQYIIGYVISNNDRKIFDLSQTTKVLGFVPQDNSENFYKS